MQRGPKAHVTGEPLDLWDLPSDRAERRIAFIQRFLRVPRGHGVGERVRLRDWQQALIRAAYGSGVRTAVVSIPRGNGKTSLAAMLGVAELFAGPPSAEVAVVASNAEQAHLTLAQARRMVENSPALVERTQIFRDRLYVPGTDATMTALPAEPRALHGLDPSLLLIDELHVVSRETWEAATTAAGKRPESLTLALSTPSTSAESVMWSLVEHGRRRDDPAFSLTEYASPEQFALDDEEGWRLGNPALGDFLAADGMRATYATTRPEVFAQLRLGRWVKGASSWLPWGAWAGCSDAAVVVPDGAPIVLGFDGSASGDSTALVGCTVPATGERPHVWVEGLWEATDPRWRVPRGEVAAAVAAAFERFDVRELAADPFGWRSEIEAWSTRWPGRVIEWPTSVPSRMGPATDRVYSAVATRTLTHDGDSRLAAHIEHCAVKSSTYGDLVIKAKERSVAKIDAAVAMIVAVDRAAFHARKPAKRRSRMIVR